ncbi:hypothetical protein CR513_46236, partial [Mucuna pruriens]
MDAMILVEVGELSLRQSDYGPEDNLDTIRTNFDLVEEAKEQAYIRHEVQFQSKTKRLHRGQPDLKKDERHQKEKERRKACIQLGRIIQIPRNT